MLVVINIIFLFKRRNSRVSAFCVTDGDFTIGPALRPRSNLLLYLFYGTALILNVFKTFIVSLFLVFLNIFEMLFYERTGYNFLRALLLNDVLRLLVANCGRISVSLSLSHPSLSPLYLRYDLAQ